MWFRRPLERALWAMMVSNEMAKRRRHTDKIDVRKATARRRLAQRAPAVEKIGEKSQMFGVAIMI